MTVKVIVLVRFNEDQPLALAKFLELKELVLKRVGAKMVKRYKLEDRIISDNLASTAILFDYPSRAAIDEVLTSNEYLQAAPFRDLAFSKYSIHIVD